MWNSTDTLTCGSYTLSSEIYGMQLLPFGNSSVPLGPIIKIPIGARLDICGGGFDERTVKVRCADAYYFVFVQDLEMQQSPFAQPEYATAG
ncbi:MAG TPA: hypothetical protein VFB14_19455 [Bryobacteraceae bacterium]|jgi:hypothetical protein|nr:hypothetical protein [Bryobacteraceae bacterium]